MLLTAATADVTALPFAAQLGTAGLFVAALFTVARAVYKRETTRADALEAEVRRLNDLIRDRYVPSLEAASEALRASERATIEVTAELRARRGRG